MVELEFGFELNPELLKGSSRPNEQVAATSSIDAMDAAILSFGPAGPGGSGNSGLPPGLGLGPMMIPVGVPFGMFPATGLPAYLPFPLMHQVMGVVNATQIFRHLEF